MTREREENDTVYRSKMWFSHRCPTILIRQSHTLSHSKHFCRKHLEIISYENHNGLQYNSESGAREIMVINTGSKTKLMI